ncbi:hypothetical protein PRZ48_007688 [Zasmidium cellare]|uniref:Zn(2)-C6 fungal-type domain-containing protein n=1 Tax=Zasmidium cellare TaxID=395010 RepID=A0ABR0EJZ5_ZASCE|nr:hypothetical protein PRZ48_007688 [Zasmidium cellare]
MQSKRITACATCHKKKIKCSGSGPPCTSCAETSSECVYPVKDRKTKVGQRYLDKILEENKRLSAIVSSINTPVSSAAQTPVEPPEPRADNADRNPLIEERPWFIAHNASDLPIHIGEAADAAFATRLRQTASTKPVSHLPRIQYMSDDTLRSLTDSNLQWPNASRMRYLVDVALNTVCRTWHIIRRSKIVASVNTVLQAPDTCDWLSACRLWALLALGEAYSSRCTLPDAPFPGSKYFAKAMAMANIPNERPRLALIEIYLLLSIYASAINRRHTASFMASYALRVSVILGLHIEISESQVRDQALREHRCRLWWTAYCFDRMWASKIGWPPSIPDDSVEIGLPSDEGLPAESRSELHDAEHIVFVVRLARLTMNAVNSLYVRKRQPTSFSERVQTTVQALSEWANDLPSRLQLNAEESGTPNERHVVFLQLSFNQTVIVTTRPIVLHLLRQRQQVSAQGSATQEPFSESALSLTNACIRCARNSMKLLKTAWSDGTITAFDYFSTQYIFSSANILALSCFLRNSGWASDHEDFLLAANFLQQLDRNGNFAAKEYFLHIEALREVVKEHISMQADGDWRSMQRKELASTDITPNVQHDLSAPTFGGGLVQNPPLQDFLNHPSIDLDFMDTGGTWLDWQDVSWPNFEPLVGNF